MTARRVFFASVVVAVLSVLASGASMPSGRIPVHFGAGGEPDRWGQRGELVVVLLAVVIGLALFMWFLARKAPTMPWELVNIPDKQHWQQPENEPVARARLAADMYATGAWCMGLFIVLAPLVALSTRVPGAAGWPTLLVIGVACASLLVGVVVRTRFYRVRR